MNDLYKTYLQVLPEGLLKKISLDIIEQVSEEISKPLDLERDRNKIQYQWRFIIDASSMVRIFINQMETELTRIEKLDLDRVAAEITLRASTNPEGVRLPRSEKPTESQIGAMIHADVEYQRIQALYLEKSKEFDYLKGFQDHLKELRQLLWTRKDNLLELSVETRNLRTEDRFNSRLT